MEGVDPQIVQKFYEYHWLKRDEEMVSMQNVSSEYKKNIIDPTRITAVFERMKKPKNNKS